MAVKSGAKWGPLKGGTSQTRALAKWLRELIDSRTLTLAKVASSVRFSKQTVSRRLSGQTRPDWSFVERTVLACAGPDGKTRTRLLSAARELWHAAGLPDASTLRDDSTREKLMDLAVGTAQGAAQLHATAQRLVRVNEHLADAQAELQQTVFVALESGVEHGRGAQAGRSYPAGVLNNPITDDLQSTRFEHLEARLVSSEEVHQGLRERMDSTEKQLEVARELLVKSEDRHRVAERKLGVLEELLGSSMVGKVRSGSPCLEAQFDGDVAGGYPLSRARAVLADLNEFIADSVDIERGSTLKVGTFVVEFLKWVDVSLENSWSELTELSERLAGAARGPAGNAVALEKFHQEFERAECRDHLFSRVWFPFVELAILRIFSTIHGLSGNGSPAVAIIREKVRLNNILGAASPDLNTLFSGSLSPVELVHLLERARKSDLRRSGRAAAHYLRVQGDVAADFAVAHALTEARDRDIAAVVYMVSGDDGRSDFLQALAGAIAAIESMVDDFMGADLTSVDLLGIPLRGVRWSETTRWPRYWDSVVLQRSVMNDGDILLVTSN